MKITLINILIFSMLIFPGLADAKKIKNSFSIGKLMKSDSGVCQLSDSVPADFINCSFAGYEKEVNANKESFILINTSDKTIKGFRVSVIYLDLKDRMLHSRSILQDCMVPPGESRKFDVKSWDNQHTYYYYLGNEPRRVATPYKVNFEPVSYWIE